ncbi:DinB family protein [Neobacillus ginsengisoli]|uniref:Damage-inducible protein DinB n=1 Tax=Neobacillus ginsengisoli TaxID=904295 RepID=A0ABT9Y0W9_9BACI|nr:DinB family protein [Neobacillus ginsengisoli]MDQ0200774.1 putative damage-inducible protein DinB [Neobacillus ginsengisoli]
MKRKKLLVVPLPGFEPEIGRWMWCLEDVRRTILERISGISQIALDTKPAGGHSIGSLLYHISLIEADWFYEDVLGGVWNPKIRSLFPQEDRNNDNTLTHIEGQDLGEHLHRLKSVRDELISHFRSMDLEDWRKPRILKVHDVTPEWVIYHLIEHESHHRGQIFQMLATLKD